MDDRGGLHVRMDAMEDTTARTLYETKLHAHTVIRSVIYPPDEYFQVGEFVTPASNFALISTKSFGHLSSSLQLHGSRQLR